MGPGRHLQGRSPEAGLTARGGSEDRGGRQWPADPAWQQDLRETSGSVGGFRPLEILGLSLAAPALLFVLLWFWVVPKANTPLAPPSKRTVSVGRSRTRPIRVFEGELPDHRKVRVFQGLTPGLEGTEAGKRALAQLGRKGWGPALTLLVRNGADRELPALKGAWSLRQGKDRTWKLVSSLHPSSPLGRLLLGLYAPEGSRVPPGAVARRLFLPAGDSRSPGKEPLYLEGPLGRFPLSPRTLPAQDVLEAWGKTKKG